MPTSTHVIISTLMAYASGILCGQYTPMPPIITIIITIIITGGYLICSRWFDPHSDKHILRAWLLVMLFLLGNLRMQITLNTLLPEGDFTFEGQIAYEPTRANKWYSSKVQGADMTIIVRSKTEQTFRYGDTIRASGKIQHPPGQRNPGGFDYEALLIRQGIRGQLYAETIEKIGHKGNPLLELSTHMREKLVAILNQSEHHEVLRAMVLGERNALDQETVQSFQRSGSAHLLAVSGLHVGLIATCCFGMFSLLSRLLPARYQIPIAALLTMITVIGYTLIIGFRPSVIRAALTCTIFLGARAVGKKLSLTDILPFVAFLLLLHNPTQLWDVGFQLSFAAVGSMVWLLPQWDALTTRIMGEHQEDSIRGTILKWGIAGFGVTWIAQLGTLILTAYYFHRIPYISLIFGPFITSLGSLVVGLCIPVIIAGSIGLEHLATYILDPTVHLFIEITKWLANTNMIWKVKTPSLGCILTYITGFYLLKRWAWHWIHHRFQMIGTVIAVISFWLISALHGGFNNKLEVTFIDVGQGDSIFVKFPNGKTLLIDAGNRVYNPVTETAWDTGERTVDPYLSHIGEFNIDLLMLSHPDADHVGGLAHIAREFNVKAIAGIKEGYSSSFAYQAFMDAAQNIPHTLNTLNFNHLSERVTIKHLHPLNKVDTEGTRKNNNSFVIKLIYGNIKILLTGDIEWETEKFLVQSGVDLSAHIMQAPHHGSKTSSTAAFIDAVSPKDAIISCGQRNKYNHPHASVVNRYEERGTRIYRTDQQGTVKIVTDGKQYKIIPFIK